jgi:hypothetical protein
VRFLPKSGYHIFKNNNERKSVGKLKAALILIALPPMLIGVLKLSKKIVELPEGVALLNSVYW